MDRVSRKTRYAALVVLSISLIACGNATLHAQQTANAERFVVTSGHPAATAAGLAVLRGGGNVVDAAVTTSLCLGVAEPYASGIGGKGMLLYRDGKTGRIYAIEAMCAASSSIDAAQFAARPQRERLTGYSSVAVPGLVAALDAVHQRWGSKPWRDVVTPAAELADDGVEVSEKMYQMMRPKRNLLRRDPEAARVYLADGETPAVGTAMKNADLAHSLRLIADKGSKAFYDGEIAERIVAAAEKAGAPLTKADFRDYKPRWSEPLVVDYDEHRVYTCPPPLTGGVTVLAMLRSLDGVAALDTTTRPRSEVHRLGRPRAVVDLSAGEPQDRRRAERIWRCRKALGSRKHSQNPTGGRRGGPRRSRGRDRRNQHAARERRRFRRSQHDAFDRRRSRRKHRLPDAIAELPLRRVRRSARHGNHLQRHHEQFFNQRADGLQLRRTGKRERSTIAPIIATKNDKPVLALGIPGGQRIPTTTIQLLIDILHFGTPLDKAFDRSRFHVRRPLNSEESGNVVDLEDDAPAEFDSQITALRWHPERHKRNGSYFGGGSAVLYQPDGRLQGVADLRRTNVAAGD